MRTAKVRTTAIGIDSIGLQAFEIIHKKRVANIDLLSYSEENNTLLPLYASTRALNLVNDSACVHDLRDNGEVVYLIIDAANYTNVAYTLAKTLANQGVFTIAVIVLSPKLREQSAEAIQQLNPVVDTLIFLANDDDFNLSTKAVADVIITLDNIIKEQRSQETSVDYADLKHVWNVSGMAAIGIAEAEGKARTNDLIQNALAAPYIFRKFEFMPSTLLLNIISGTTAELEMEELTAITESIQNELGIEAEIIFGHALDESLGSKIKLELVASMQPTDVRRFLGK
ncbi:hypothetical protein [uncultured Pontibacter sp.]|uniref:hypothetical protein n=1 Tax=uncultured Pontibacter sp. TaxID=453356 RepID=UPI002629CC24|nr:hypothetical protein [uncultured Pontibacter sp.]